MVLNVEKWRSPRLLLLTGKKSLKLPKKKQTAPLLLPPQEKVLSKRKRREQGGPLQVVDGGAREMGKRLKEKEGRGMDMAFCPAWAAPG